MALTNAKPKVWTRDLYYRMAEMGLFAPDERVELIEGEIVPVASQGRPHAFNISKLNTTLVRRFGDTHVIRVQLPLDLGELSQPEPDFAIVRIEDNDAAALHPTSADLVIEVAFTSVKFDRHEKASMYAKAGIPELWVNNLASGQLEVYRHPGPDREAVFGNSYKLIQILRSPETLSPLFAPQTVFTVDELLTGTISSFG